MRVPHSPLYVEYVLEPQLELRNFLSDFGVNGTLGSVRMFLCRHSILYHNVARVCRRGSLFISAFGSTDSRIHQLITPSTLELGSI